MLYKKFGCLQILCLVLLVGAKEAERVKRVQKRGVVENFGEGLKFAGQMFGINTAADVANLVAMAFAKKKPDFMSMFQQKQTTVDDSETEATQQEADSQEREKASAENEQRKKQTQQEKDASYEQSEPVDKSSAFSPSRFVTGVLRMIGFDATKLGALAINALILFAQTIGNAFTSPPRSINPYASQSPPPSINPYGNEEDDDVPDALRDGEREAHQPRALRAGTPIDWYLENPDEGMRRTLDDALDTRLTDRITEMIEYVEQRDGGQGGCLKLLMCKSSPIIWGMQRSVSERVTGKVANTTDEETSQKEKEKPKKLFSTDVFFTHLPTIAEFREHGTVCDERFGKECNLNADYGNRRAEKHATKKEKGNK
uniref:Protein FAM179B n=1 Tax=Zeugodacus cucurbitae TaxID=28588 RepID=A0A0A1WZ33_ZEUCU